MIIKLMNKHECRGYYPELDKEPMEGCDNFNELENQLFEKWKDFIPKGWYGFSIGKVPDKWYHLIDDFLEYMDSILASFEIHQIKLKWGGIRFYVHFDAGDDETNEFLRLQIEKLESVLFSEALIF